MAEYFLELLTEEIPAWMLGPRLDTLRGELTELLSPRGIEVQPEALLDVAEAGPHLVGRDRRPPHHQPSDALGIGRVARDHLRGCRAPGRSSVP